MSKLTIGEQAPDFKLIGLDLKPISKSDYSGKHVIVLFFPLAFTSGCTTEMCTMRDNFDVYAQLNAEILGISVDSPFVLRKFKEENEINFALGSDFGREASKAYDTLFTDDFMGLTEFSKRSAFVINPNGVLTYKEMIGQSNLPDFEKMNAVL